MHIVFQICLGIIASALSAFAWPSFGSVVCAFAAGVTFTFAYVMFDLRNYGFIKISP